MKTSKKEEMHNWLEANPGKTERDWLIEERCTSDEQRKLLKEVFASCGEEYVQVPATINIGGAGGHKFVEQNYHKKYPEILGGNSKFARFYLVLRSDHKLSTDIEFDFSLFGKFYFDLKDNKWSIDCQDTPSNQWKKCLLDKLGNLTDLENTDAENIASLIILDNSKLMSNTPLYRFGSPEFIEAFDYEVNRRKYIKGNGFDKTPRLRTHQPGFGNVAYTRPSAPHMLTVREFLEKITGPDICKGGRLIIALFNAEGKTLKFPDEAVCNLSKNAIYSGYYEESPVIIPGPIQLDKVAEFKGPVFEDSVIYPLIGVRDLRGWNVCMDSLDKPLVAYTKRYGKRSVMDVVPFEWRGYAYIALVVNEVL